MTKIQNQALDNFVAPSWRTHWRSLALCFVISFGIAGIGNALTELGPWYYQLKHPAWKPPDAAFGAIWTLIFTLCAISAWLAWHQAPTLARRTKVIGLYLYNGSLNILWSFFVLSSPQTRLGDVGVAFPLAEHHLADSGAVARVAVGICTGFPLSDMGFCGRGAQP